MYKRSEINYAFYSVKSRLLAIRPSINVSADNVCPKYEEVMHSWNKMHEVNPRTVGYLRLRCDQ